jgi:hypothetical protein
VPLNSPPQRAQQEIEPVTRPHHTLPPISHQQVPAERHKPLLPVYHRREDRIRAHVIPCWLALLLARIAENAWGRTWPELRRELDNIHVGTFAGPAGVHIPASAQAIPLNGSVVPRVCQVNGVTYVPVV